MRTISAFCVVCILTALPAIAETNGDEAAAAAKTYASLFETKEKEALASRDRADDVALGEVLVTTAEELGDKDPALRRIMYEKAFALAKEDKAGHATADRAITRLMELAPADAATWQGHRVELLADAYRTSTRDDRFAETGPAYLDALVTQGDALMQEGKASDGVAAYRQAMLIATQIRDTDSRKRLQQTILDARPALLLERKIQVLEGRLDRDAAATDAAKELTMIYLLELGNHDRARAFATKANDAALVDHLRVLAVEPSVWKVAALLKTGTWLKQAGENWSSDIGKRRAFEWAFALFEDVGSREGLSSAEQIQAKVAVTELEQALKQLDDVKLPEPVGGNKRLKPGLIVTEATTGFKTITARGIYRKDFTGHISPIQKLPTPAPMRMKFDGYIRIPKTGTYRFHIWGHVDRQEQEGFILNGQPITAQAKTDKGFEIRLARGDVPVQFDTDGSGGGRLKVSWQPPGAKEPTIIPAEAFFHDPAVARKLKMGILIKADSLKK